MGVGPIQRSLDDVGMRRGLSPQGNNGHATIMARDSHDPRWVMSSYCASFGPRYPEEPSGAQGHGLLGRHDAQTS